MTGWEREMKGGGFFSEIGSTDVAAIVGVTRYPATEGQLAARNQGCPVNVPSHHEKTKRAS